MDRNQQIPIRRRLAAVFVILGLLLVSLAAVSPLTHHHSHDHDHDLCTLPHPAQPGMDAASQADDAGPIQGQHEDESESPCGFCMLLMGAPAPLAVDLPRIGAPTRIGWLSGQRSTPVHRGYSTSPSGRGPPV